MINSGVVVLAFVSAYCFLAEQRLHLKPVLPVLRVSGTMYPSPGRGEGADNPGVYMSLSVLF